MPSAAEVFGDDDNETRFTALDAQCLDWKALMDGEDSGEDWLAKPVLANGRAHSLYAPAKAGKSLLALYLAACVAAGKAVLGREASEPVPVLYVDYEMTPEDVKSRLLDMGFESADLATLHYLQLPTLAPLDTKDGGALLVAYAIRLGVQLVVVDTTGRAISGGENDADTFLGFYRFLVRPLKQAGITSLRLDHAGKDYGKGQRGSSAKADDVDVVWSLEPRDVEGTRRPYVLTATHKRMGWVPASVQLDFLSPDDGSGWMEWTMHSNGQDGGWPAGTKALAEQLDALGLSEAVRQRDARAAMKVAGIGAKQSVLVAALKYRRDRL